MALPYFLLPDSGDAGDRARRNTVANAPDLSAILGAPAEREIVSRVRGEEDDARSACAALYLKYAPQLIPFANGYVYSPAVAEEIVHDVFLSIWTRRTEWSPANGIVAYLFAAVRNRALKNLRHHAVASHYGQRMAQAAVAVSLPVESDASELTQALRRAIAALPERSREAISLRKNRGLSYREIGAILGVSEDAARVRIARAEQQLREALKPLLGE